MTQMSQSQVIHINIHVLDRIGAGAMGFELK